MTFTAKVDLPFPNVPAELVEQAIKISSNNSFIALRRKTDDNYTGSFCLRFTSMEMLNWVQTNISKQISTVWVQTIRGGDFGPHIDGPSPVSNTSRRYYNLMYIIKTGGDNVLTHFYEPINSEIGDRVLFKPEEIVLTDTFKYKPNSWNLMNNQAIHSVEGVNETRLGLSISLYKPELPDFLATLVSETA